MKDKLLELGYSEAQADLIANKKVYFQNDVDNITEKVKITLNKEFDKKFNELSNENNKIKLETRFIEAGGNKTAFEDFYNSTKHVDFNQDGVFDELRNSKSYFFHNQESVANQINQLDEIRNTIKLEDNSHLINGTIYRK